MKLRSFLIMFLFGYSLSVQSAYAGEHDFSRLLSGTLSLPWQAELNIISSVASSDIENTRYKLRFQQGAQYKLNAYKLKLTLNLGAIDKGPSLSDHYLFGEAKLNLCKNATIGKLTLATCGYVKHLHTNYYFLPGENSDPITRSWIKVTISGNHLTN